MSRYLLLTRTLLTTSFTGGRLYLVDPSLGSNRERFICYTLEENTLTLVKGRLTLDRLRVEGSDTAIPFGWDTIDLLPWSRALKVKQMPHKSWWPSFPLSHAAAKRYGLPYFNTALRPGSLFHPMRKASDMAGCIIPCSGCDTVRGVTSFSQVEDSFPELVSLIHSLSVDERRINIVEHAQSIRRI